MKNIVSVLLLCSILAACGTVTTTEKTPGRHTVSYDFDGPDDLSNNAYPTPYAINLMTQKSDKLCPNGYRKLEERRVIKPPMDSKYVWEIECTED